jgi:probable HAF family extracellular repeat protein
MGVRVSRVPPACNSSGVAVGAAMVLLACTSSLAQPAFTGLGDLPGGSFYSEAWGVSRDGTTVVGASIINGNVLFGGTYAAFRWTAATGMVDIYDLGTVGTVCRAYAVNGDGSVVVGSACYGQLTPTQTVAFYWTPVDGAVEIGDLPGGPSGSPRAAARGVSADGMIIAGQGESDSGAEPFRYTRADSTFLGLGDLPGGTFGGSGYGISANGVVIVGSSIAGDNSETHAFRWTQAGGMVDIGTLGVPPGYTPFAEAYGANADGTVIVGLSRSMASLNNGWEAFRWTQAGGMAALGDLPGGAILSEAYATTPDGSIVVGKGGVAGVCNPFGCPTAPHAFIWDAQHGMRDLNTVLPALGLNLGAWVLTEARGISASGRVIVGTGTNPQGNVEAWRAVLPPPTSPADFNSNGTVSVQDIFDFLAAWFAGDLRADFNHSGAVTVQDLFDFLAAWFAGC